MSNKNALQGANVRTSCISPWIIERLDRKLMSRGRLVHKIIGRWSHSSLSQVSLSFTQSFASTAFVPSNCLRQEQVLFILYFKTWAIWKICEDELKTRKTSDVRGWMAVDNVTSHFSTMLEPITSASFLSSLSIIHDFTQNSSNKQTQSTHRKSRLEPAIRDAQKLTQNVFPPWRPLGCQGVAARYWRHSLWWHLLKSKTNMSASLCLLVAVHKSVSSVKSRMWDFRFTPILKMWMRNIKGPSTVPCGTPDLTDTGADCPYSQAWIHLLTCSLYAVVA